MMVQQILADGLHQTMATFGAGLAQGAAYVWGTIAIFWLLVAGFGLHQK